MEARHTGKANIMDKLLKRKNDSGDGRTKTGKDIWVIISLGVLGLYLLFLLFPLFKLLKQAVYTQDGFTLEYLAKFFSKPYYTDTLINSMKVSSLATLLTLVIGVPLAYFYNMYEIKGKTIIQVLIILCSMSAPFIGAYSWILLLGRNGLVTKLILNLTGFRIGSIYGFNGILLVLSLQLFPLVFLYVSGALKNIDNSLLEASENMGCSGIKRFFKVIIPLCMPTILAATLLVFMRAFADFGTPLLIGEGYRTFPVEIYAQYFGEVGTDHNFGAAISVIAIIITAVIFLFQRYVNSKFQFTMNALHPVERKKAKGIFNVLIHAFTYFVVGVAFAPQAYVIYTSFQNTSGKLFVEGYSFKSYYEAFDRMGNAIQNTFIIGGIALILIILLAILISYLVVRRNNQLNKLIDTLSMVPYIIPGSVVGIALVIAFNTKPIVLTGTALIMVVALIIRRIPYTIRSSVAILQQIPITIEEAAISLGSSKMKAFFTVTVPMMGNGILSGAILSWVTIITELSTAIILYNLKTITLTLAIYTYVSRGNYGIAAALATILTVLTIISLIIFMKVSKTKEITF
ncbi:MAG: iron ABC transporter permease [Erysipelotrichaceae bacterium]|nr:iron ABC transporter permease [Erysipelotrichaceae bacterium]MDD3923812.1 iron ABC transporter permease [Erysipelotrichaceae bacterium]MDD4641889.1 iron ABC transporter permease [Erysipelotrichaceae bacterium]